MSEINTREIIDKIYPEEKLNYFKLYGTDVLITTITLFIFIIIVIYFGIINKFPEIRKNWPENKCKPLYIPLAGYIVNDPNKSKFEVVQDTYNGCITGILTSIIDTALEPVYYAMSVATSALNDLITAIDNIRNILSRTRSNITKISESIIGKL